MPAVAPETPRSGDGGPPPSAAEVQERTAQRLGQTVAQTNAIGMPFRLLPPGEFAMGSAEGDMERLEEGNWFFAGWALERIEAEFPRHKVRLTQPFLMGTHEVTVGQFRTFVSRTGYKTVAERSPAGGFGWTAKGWQKHANFNWLNPGFPQSETHPVANVAWEDANEFCKWLSKLEGQKYRLPTEAEWEYACRAGTTTWFSSGDSDQELKKVANLADQSLRLADPEFGWARPWNDGFPFTAPVGKFAPNAFGLHDMHGNAWEWCLDYYDPEYYSRSPATDPLCSESAPYHVFRGGGWDNYPGFCRSADRYSSHSPKLRTEWAGFRIVKELATKKE